METPQNASRTFHIKSCLGRGGFGEVYRATMVSSSGLRSDVAVKVLREDVDLKSDAVRRLRDEGRLLATLNHPAILRVLDFANLQGRIALVTEYIEGEDLNGCITGGNPMPARALVEVIGSVAEALQVAWASPTETGTPLKLVHRDIKPSNIRISRHGEVRLLDFGIAWSESAQREAQTSHNSAVGSLVYMAPERFGRGKTASAADVYALGCTLFEGLMDEQLFAGAVAVEQVTRAADGEDHDAYVEQRLLRLEDDLDPRVLELLRGMLKHDQTQRPTGAEVAMRCEQLVDDLTGLSLKRWCRRRAWPTPTPIESGWIEQTFVDGDTTSTRLDGIQQDPNATFSGVTSETFLMGDVSAAQPLPDTETQDFALLPSEERARLTAEEPAAEGKAGGVPWYYIAGPVSLATAVVVFAGVAVMQGQGTDAADAAPGDVTTEPATAGSDAQTPAESKREKLKIGLLGKPEPPAEPDPATEPDPVELAPPRPPPVRPANVKPIMPVKPMPVEPDPVVETAPDPRAVEPEPEPEPEPTFGKVTSIGADVKIQLRSGGNTHGLGQVPVGRHDLYVDFGNGEYIPQGRVDVIEGRIASIDCNVMTYACDTK